MKEKNICEFTVDGKIEKDTANLIFLSDWFENNLKFILSEEDKFPYKIKGNCGIEIREKAYEMGNKNHEEIEWFEKFMNGVNGIYGLFQDSKWCILM